MKKIFLVFAIIIIIGVGCFYGGMKYGQSKDSAAFKGGNGNLTNLSAEERQARMQQFGANSIGNLRGAGTRTNGDGFVGGEIISKDDKSLTIKMADGSTKIVLFSSSIQITKSVSGIIDDLKIGENIQVNGTANQDGSITAQSIQLRSNVVNRP